MARIEREVVFMYKVRAYCEKCKTGELFVITNKDLIKKEILHICDKCGAEENLSEGHPRFVYKK
jgi:Zn finger protein HypA/HybF involved in hydrogenase expression